LNKENTELLEKINSVIEKYEEDGTLDALKEKWIYSTDIDSKKIEVGEYDAPNGTLKIAIDPSYTGLSFLSNGEYKGYEVELINLIAKELGYKLEYSTEKFSGLIAAVSSKKSDIGIGCITKTEERSQSVAFSSTTVLNSIVAIVNPVFSDTTTKTSFWDDVKTSFNRTFVIENRWKMIVEGFLTTLIITIASIILGTIMGFFYSFALRSENKIIRKITGFFSNIYTGMPIVVVLLILFYVVFAKSRISALMVAIIGLSIDFCISTASILNTGVMGVSAGQKLAAIALGYKKIKVFTKIVLPQAANQMFPQYQAAIGGLIKATAVVGYITVEDLTRITDIIRSRTYEAFFPLLATALIYLVLARVIIRGLNIIGNNLNPETRKEEKILKGIDQKFASFNKKTVGVIYDNEMSKANKNKDVLVSLRHVEKAFPDVTPLKDVNAEIRRGDVIAIIGPSGTGKSTLLGCINKLIPATSGEIWIDGENIMDPSCNIEDVRSNIGMVFQSFNLFEHKTVVENVMMGPIDVYKRDRSYMYGVAIGLLDLVGLADKALAYPNQLSGGQKQRVAIARTLAMGPELILFDEPTSALDPSMVGEVQSVIKTLAKTGFTMLIVTHDLAFAREVANRVFYMDQGIIYDDGTPENILDNPQNPVTKAFILRKKAFVRNIIGSHYDYIAAANDIIDFGKQNWWTKKQINDANTIFEEIIEQLLQNHYEDNLSAEFVINYFEANQTTEITVTYNGDSYNPIDSADELVQKLISNAFEHSEYTYENNVNTLKFTK